MPESPVQGKLARRVWRGAFGEVPLLWQLAGCLPYLSQPKLQSWSEQDEPLRLQELNKEKNDPDPKALACYGMLSPADGSMHLRFVSGRPVSQVTIDFLEWLCERVVRRGKQVLVLVWDNASWHVSKQVKTWLCEHNQAVLTTGGVRIIPCWLPSKRPWLKSRHASFTDPCSETDRWPPALFVWTREREDDEPQAVCVSLGKEEEMEPNLPQVAYFPCLLFRE